MPHEKILLPLDIYYAYLRKIKGIEFTPREVDVIACLLNRRATSISSFLSIGSRAVETHMRYIRQKAGNLAGRENIISFAESAENFSLLKNEYYLNLRIRIFFEEQLRNISKKIDPQFLTCVLIYDKEQNYNLSLIPSLKEYLKKSGFKVASEARESASFFMTSPHSLSPSHATSIIYISLSEPTSAQLNQLTFQESTQVILLLLGSCRNTELYKKLKNIIVVEFKDQKNYYLFFFELLKKLLPSYDFNKDIENFIHHCKEVYNSTNGRSSLASRENEFQKIVIEKKKHPEFLERIFKKRKGHFFLGGALCLCFVGIMYFIFKENKEESINSYNSPSSFNSIRSDLLVPTESVFLNRPELLTQIANQFKEQSDIQITALVGIGGAGKTTLARQYARSQTSPIIWEINAETPSSLRDSFEKLAHALSQTEEDQKILRGLLEIKQKSAREDKVLQFVKKLLRKSPNWLLIYDNIVKFTDIQKYIPAGINVWGRGKVILITRDGNIINNKYINNIIKIGELRPDQKRSLFIKIMSDRNKQSFTCAQQKEAMSFVEQIPPFPLDITVAAFYLKSSNTSYPTYLENITQNAKDIANIQESLLKEAGDYNKTRYGIITLALQQLINTHPDFKELLLFISLLDSENIPRDLLDSYKNKVVVDSFIYNLKKYSFITRESSHFLYELPTFSIHRSIQEISLGYLIKSLNPTTISQFLQAGPYVIESYIEKAIDKEDLVRIKILASHYKMLLSHHKYLTEEVKLAINAELGCIYFYLGNYDKAKTLLESSLTTLKNQNSKDYKRIIHSSLFLANICRELGKYDQANHLLEQSLEIAKAHFSKSNIETAWIMAYLGNIYRDLGEYQKAKDTLEQSVKIYKEYGPEHNAGFARALAYLGHVSRIMGDYKNAKGLLEKSLTIYKSIYSEAHIRTAQVLVYLGIIEQELGNYEQARNILEKSVLIYKKQFGENHVYVAWALGHLGNVNTSLGHYENAKKLIEESLRIYRAHFPEDHIEAMWVSVLLGKIYTYSGNYNRATHLLKKALITYEKNYGKNHIQTTKVIRALGEAYLLEGQINTAEELFLKVLKALHQINHPDKYITLENLADTYVKKFLYEKHKGEIQQTQELKHQAVNYLTQALEFLQIHFSADSPHIKRIHAKLEKIKKE